MIDQVCKDTVGLKQVIDHEKMSETKLRVRWEETLVEIDALETRIGDLTTKYGLEQGDTVIFYRLQYQ